MMLRCVLHHTRQLTNHLPTTCRNIRSVVLLNLQSYAGGMDLFIGRKKGFQVPESGDTPPEPTSGNWFAALFGFSEPFRGERQARRDTVQRWLSVDDEGYGEEQRNVCSLLPCHHCC